MRLVVIKDDNKNEVFAVRFLDNALAFFNSDKSTAEQQNKKLEQLAFACYQLYKSRGINFIEIVSIKQMANELSVGCLLNRGQATAASEGHSISFNTLNQNSSTHQFHHFEAFPHIERVLVKEKFDITDRGPSPVVGSQNINYRLQFLQGFDVWKIRFELLLGLKADRLNKLRELSAALQQRPEGDQEVKRIQAFIKKEEQVLEDLLPISDIDAEEQKKRLGLFANRTALTAVYTTALAIYNNYVLGAGGDQQAKRQQFYQSFKDFGFSDEHGQLLPLTEDSLSVANTPSIVISINTLLKKLKAENIKWSSSWFSRSTYAAIVLEDELEQAVKYINDNFKEFLELVEASPFSVLKEEGVVWLNKPHVFDEKSIDAEITDILQTDLGLATDIADSSKKRGWQEVYREIADAIAQIPSFSSKQPVFEPTPAEEQQSLNAEVVSGSSLASSASSSDSSSSSTTASTATPLNLSTSSLPEEQSPSANVSNRENSSTPQPDPEVFVPHGTPLNQSDDALGEAVPPRRRKPRKVDIASAPKPIDHAALIDNIRKHLELSVWGKRGAFGASWVGGTSEALPESIRRIKTTVLDPNMPAALKFAQIKRDAQRAIAENSPRRLETTAAYLAIFNQADRQIAEYFASQAVASENASISGLLADLKDFIESVDWDITKGPMPHAIQITQAGGLVVEKYVPKHVADQHEVLVKHFNQGVNTEADNLATFQKVEKIALKACDEGNRHRSKATANYYSMFSSPRFAMKDNIIASKEEIRTRPERNAACLVELQVLYDHIRSKTWEVKGWFFIKRTVCLNGNGGGALGRPDQLPEHIKAQYMKIEALLAGNSKDDALTVFEKVKKIAVQANAKLSKGRYQAATDYYQAFVGIEKPADIRSKLMGVQPLQNNI